MGQQLRRLLQPEVLLIVPCVRVPGLDARLGPHDLARVHVHEPELSFVFGHVDHSHHGHSMLLCRAIRSLRRYHVCRLDPVHHGEHFND